MIDELEILLEKEKLRKMLVAAFVLLALFFTMMGFLSGYQYGRIQMEKKCLNVLIQQHRELATEVNVLSRCYEPHGINTGNYCEEWNRNYKFNDTNCSPFTNDAQELYDRIKHVAIDAETGEQIVANLRIESEIQKYIVEIAQNESPKMVEGKH